MAKRSGREFQRTIILLAVVITTHCAVALLRTIYVDDNATGTNDGSSWANAFIHLQDALDDAILAEKPLEVRVAQGTYKPDRGQNYARGDREASFELINGVILAGGYAGIAGIDPDNRDVHAYETILTGDLEGDDASSAASPYGLLTDRTRADNSYHVVTANLRIQGSEYLGLFGQLGSEAKISDLGLEAIDFNEIAGITGNTAVGGLVGSNNGGSISTCYSNGIVNGTGRLGGLVGSNSGAISNCNSTGSISSSGWGWHIGGLVGLNGGNISNSYSTGTVSGGSSVGGLVGSNYRSRNNGSITASYSTSMVSGNEHVGGLVEGFGGPVYNSFWDVEISGQMFSAGGTGKTTAEMQTASTFLEAGWDFLDETANGTEDIWWILEGQDYPRLWWELAEEDVMQ